MKGFIRNLNNFAFELLAKQKTKSCDGQHSFIFIFRKMLAKLKSIPVFKVKQ